MGERASREGISIGYGTASDWRNLQRRSRRGVSLEGLGAERTRDTAVGCRRNGEWHAALGAQVLRLFVRPPMAAGRRTHLRLALHARTIPAQRGTARARG